MIEEKITVDDMLKELSENYMPKLFYFCLKKTGDVNEAEDLASEITLSVITQLHKGNLPRNFPAWVWQIARNKYSKWADRKANKGSLTESIDVEGFDLSSDSDFEEAIEKKEYLSLIRRELAFISTDYRNILVSFYIDDRKVKDIALSLGLPEGTVKTKLFRARQLLKEGIEMAREFGKKSYKPEQVTFVNNCSSFGDRGQPWSILEHMMYKNIFLEAYGNPKTAEELALEIGIALPYMEDELEFLVKETFLIKNGNKYETSFPIVSKDTQLYLYKRSQALKPKLSEKLEEYVDAFNDICVKNGINYYGDHISYEDAKWTLLMNAYEKYYIPVLDRYTNNEDHRRTERPYNGKWDIVGYENVVEDIYDDIFVGKHSVMDIDESKPFSDYSQYVFFYENMPDRIPFHLNQEEAYALKLVAENKTDLVSQSVLNSLTDYGYLIKTDDRYIPQYLILNGNESKITDRFTEEDKVKISKIEKDLGELIDRLFDGVEDVIKKEFPRSLHGNKKLTADAVCDLILARGHIFKYAIESGWLKYTEDTIPTAGSYILM